MHCHKPYSPVALAVGVALLAGAGSLRADSPITQDSYITGALVVDWKTRLPENQDGEYPKVGVADVYAMDVTVGHTFYKGKISCVPYVFSKHIGRVLQEGACQYDVDLGVINPSNVSQRLVVGKLAGNRPKDKDGRSDLAAGNLRMEIQSVGRAKGFVSNFGGAVIGSPVQAKTTLAELIAEAKQKTATITRMAGGKEVSVTLEGVDPVTFQGVTLAAGPSSTYPEARVDGQFVYSYETDNWFPTLTVIQGGTKDRISGGMKWVDVTDNSGHYQLNILLNEDQGPQGEAAAFAEPQGLDAFFMADPGKSTINGTISFKDTRMAGVEDPIKSEIGYNIGVQKVTAQQAQVFWKTLMLIPSQIYGE